jgi:hypothetical protein
MSARAIVSGVLFKAPVSKTSKAGKPYVLATIREGSGERTRWWTCFAFSDALIEELVRLGDGDPLAVSGEFDADVYAPDGSAPRVNWRITVDAVISARRKAPAKRAAGKQQAAAKSWASPAGAPLNDSIPFAPEWR